jgi:hypothetical protein
MWNGSYAKGENSSAVVNEVKEKMDQQETFQREWLLKLYR